MKHSLSPWKAEWKETPQGLTKSIKIVVTGIVPGADEKQRVIATMNLKNHWAGYNAVMMAAAPDMLKALKDIAESFPFYAYGDCQAACGMVDIARAMIEKLEPKKPEVIL